MSANDFLKIAGIIVAIIMVIITSVSLLIIFNSDSSPEDKLTGLVMLMIPTEVNLIQVFAGGGIIGAIITIAIIWFFANYVNK